MATMEELHGRLDAVGAKVEAARKEMEFKHRLNDGHNLTSGELLARHKFLKDKLDEEIAENEAHDHHVSALEQDVMNWINSLDMSRS